MIAHIFKLTFKLIKLGNVKKMKITTKLLILWGLLFGISSNGESQPSIAYYSSSLAKIGVGYDFSNKFRGELRVYSNTFREDITPEIVLCYNIIRREYHSIYIGLGYAFNIIDGLVIPAGIQFSPIPDFKRFSLHVELQPTYEYFEGMILQASWGLRYKFNGQ
ncbi:MAG: hypothetical protein EA362_09900 [Saprospirales bacterium]|nr:MAG: hypothetical protein EA362_09900 [Saprospirales bacterium]